MEYRGLARRRDYFDTGLGNSEPLFLTMKRARLNRISTGPEGTFGRLVVLDDNNINVLFECVTLELPWNENKKGISCVPTGDFLFKWRTDSPAHGEVYEEWDDPDTAHKEDVPNRERIQIHAANLAGDPDLGFVKQLEGCIAPGRGAHIFKGGKKPAGSIDQRGITASGPTLKTLVAVLNKEIFKLEIRWDLGVLK